MLNFLLIALSMLLVGCGWQEALQYAEAADGLTQTGSDMGVPYLGLANMATGFLVEFIRGRIEKRSILKHAGALYRGVDAHLKTLPEKEQERGIEIMQKSVKAIVGAKRYDKANKLLHVAKEYSRGA